MNVIDFVDTKKDEHLEELKEFLRIPSISTTAQHKTQVERAARWVAEHLAAAGMQTVDIVPTALHPLVYAESAPQEGQPTVLVYGHYDVQPPEPLELWTSPPFEPTIRDGNLYGRGTADDKGQVHVHLKALQALQMVHGKLPINVKVLIEGEEEVGSKNLWDFVRRNHQRLTCDALVLSDTTMIAPGVPSITYALRGLNYYQVEIVGPTRDLHSGLYGGAVPNPLTILAHTLARFHDKNLRVAIPGFYRDVAKLVPSERKRLKNLPWDEQEFRKTVGAAAICGEKGYSIVEQVWCRPTFEVNGIWGGYTGDGAKTVIPSKAYAKFSTRLVPNQDPDKIAILVEQYFRKLLPEGITCHFQVLSKGKAWIAPYRHPIVQAAAAALEEGFGRKAVFIREGGSIPIVAEISALFRIPAVLIGFGLPDENAHAPDEHISLDHYFGGIKSAARFYERIASLNGGLR